jgi:hypothetical protein
LDSVRDTRKPDCHVELVASRRQVLEQHPSGALDSDDPNVTEAGVLEFAFELRRKM